MGDFDFRDLLGGASASVTPDERLADGIDDEQRRAVFEREGQKALDFATYAASFICINSAVRGVSAGGVLGMIAEIIAEGYRSQAGDTGLRFIVSVLRDAIDTIEARLD